jgi:hypothetical protein
MNEETVTIVFPNKETREEFLDWFSNEGEQVYWDSLEQTGDMDKAVTFDMDFNTGHIETKLYEE